MSHSYIVSESFEANLPNPVYQETHAFHTCHHQSESFLAHRWAQQHEMTQCWMCHGTVEDIEKITTYYNNKSVITCYRMWIRIQNTWSVIPPSNHMHGCPNRCRPKLRSDTNQEIISGVFVDGGLHDCSGVGVHCFRICQRLFCTDIPILLTTRVLVTSVMFSLWKRRKHKDINIIILYLGLN